MASRLIFAFLILNDPLFIQIIHEGDFILISQITNKRGIGVNSKSLLDSIGITQSGVAYQPYLNLLAHLIASLNTR